jgi:beta-lactamase regulating signal transducer with metallopeptidase domain
MSSLFALRALLFASELLAGSMLIMIFAWAAATQRAASARHLIWAGSFGAVLLLPVLAATVSSPIRILLPGPQAFPPTQTLQGATMAAMPPATATSGISLDPSTIALALGALWLLGVSAIVLRFAIGMVCLAALKRRSRLYAVAPDNLPKVAATRRECELRLSDSEHGPIAFGMFRPVILLPKNASSWPRERLHAVLLHELAHIRRRDSLAQLLSHLACALYWPNPLVWIGARSLRREAEIAADDTVIVSGIKPSAYAGELLRLATEFRARQSAFSGIPLFMAASSALEARVESVLAPTTLRSGVTKMDVLKITGLGLVAATALAFACPSLAQKAAPATPSLPAVIAPPEVLPAPPTPSTPSADIDAPAPSVPAEPAAHAEMTTPHASIMIDEHGVHRMRSIDLKRMHDDIALARREAREAIAKEKPQIEKALAEARASREETVHSIREAQPQIDAAVDEVTKVRPEIDEALAKAQPEIDKALEKIRTELAKAHFDADIQIRVDEALKRAEVRLEATRMRVRERTRDEQDDSSSDSE